MTLQIDAELAFSATPSAPSPELSMEGFNEYGVRRNITEDGQLTSIDVVYRAMEPGLRKNFRITPEFLQGVVEDFTQIGSAPAQFDHSASQRANVGTVTDAWYAANALYLQLNIPNTGSSIRTDTIADFTFEPPAITDGSVGFGNDYEIELDEATGEYVLLDAQFREFSLTPFPAGYDNGGLSAAFCDAARSHGLFVDETESTATVETEADTPASVSFSYARISELDLTDSRSDETDN